MDDDVAATKRVSIGGVILTVDLLVYQVTEIMLKLLQPQILYKEY